MNIHLQVLWHGQTGTVSNVAETVYGRFSKFYVGPSHQTVLCRINGIIPLGYPSTSWVRRTKMEGSMVWTHSSQIF